MKVIAVRFFALGFCFGPALRDDFQSTGFRLGRVLLQILKHTDKKPADVMCARVCPPE
jgi:hypothetical protein